MAFPRCIQISRLISINPDINIYATTGVIGHSTNNFVISELKPKNVTSIIIAFRKMKMSRPLIQSYRFRTTRSRLVVAWQRITTTTASCIVLDKWAILIEFVVWPFNFHFRLYYSSDVVCILKSKVLHTPKGCVWWYLISSGFRISIYNELLMIVLICVCVRWIQIDARDDQRY